MEADAAEVPAHLAADLEQLQPEGVELHPGDVEPEGVGAEGMVTEPVGKAASFQVLAPELGSTTPLDVPGVEGFGDIVPVGDDKPEIRRYP